LGARGHPRVMLRCPRPKAIPATNTPGTTNVAASPLWSTAMFKALPDRYAPPQYPGFWAMSLANGAKAEPDPANGSSATAGSTCSVIPQEAYGQSRNLRRRRNPGRFRRLIPAARTNDLPSPLVPFVTAVPGRDPGISPGHPSWQGAASDGREGPAMTVYEQRGVNGCGAWYSRDLPPCPAMPITHRGPRI
jgi:hypothetical protein